MEVCAKLGSTLDGRLPVQTGLMWGKAIYFEQPSSLTSCQKRHRDLRGTSFQKNLDETELNANNEVKM